MKSSPNCNDLGIKENVRECRKGFSKILKHYNIKLIIGGKEETPDEILDKWINGKIFHEDTDKKNFIDKLKHSKIFYECIFVSTILDLIPIIIITANNVKLIIKNGK